MSTVCFRLLKKEVTVNEMASSIHMPLMSPTQVTDFSS